MDSESSANLEDNFDNCPSVVSDELAELEQYILLKRIDKQVLQ